MAEAGDGLSMWTRAKRHETKHTAMTPRRLRLPDYLAVVHRADPERIRRVPVTAISDEGVDEEGEFAFIACPCGHRPVVRARLERCPGCERYYTLEDLGVAFVVYGEMAPPG